MTDGSPRIELRRRLEAFVRYRNDHLTGDEKGEAQIFVDRLFQAFGHGGVREAGATLENRVRGRDMKGTAFADLVWKPRLLIEMKRSGEPLTHHYRQAFEYWLHLVPDRPRYVVLCNFDEFWIYDLETQVGEPVDRITTDDLPRRWEALAFLLPEPQEPSFQNDLVEVTRESASRLASVFHRLVARGLDRRVAQPFILQTVMSMFGEDIELLPGHYFKQAVLDSLEGRGSSFDLVFGLFREMNTPGETVSGRFAGTPYFNGGLFGEVVPFELQKDELADLLTACSTDWSKVQVPIFGTLFEQSLDETDRHAYGAHFTSEADIYKVVFPTIVRPWRERIDAAETVRELGEAEHDLHDFRVLDPTCGAGNFLYVAYRELRRLERDLMTKLEEVRDLPETAPSTMRRRRGHFPQNQQRWGFVSTEQFFGIDIKPFAVELAKITLMLARKLAADELQDELKVLPLDDLQNNFTVGDALKVPWPKASVIIGNPPYLGRRRIVGERGADYASWLAETFPQVGGVSDYVVYFFRRTHDELPPGGRAGLVGTQAIRRGDSRVASLDYITGTGGVIYEAVSSQPWSGEASVAVSIVNWTKDVDVTPKHLWLSDGSLRLEVSEILPSLSVDVDVSDAKLLRVNRKPKLTFQGQTPGRSGFVIDPATAERLVQADPASLDVVHPYLVGEELKNDARPSRFIIDIPDDDLVGASQWSGAIDLLRKEVLPLRKQAAEEEAARNEEALRRHSSARVNWHHRNFLNRWWQLSYRRTDLLQAIAPLSRYIALSRVAVHSRASIYTFVSADVRPGDAVQVFAFDDLYSLGILHSALHRAWFEARCSRMRTDLRYTPNTVFDSFPWPQAPGDGVVQEVEEVAGAIVEHREAMLARGVTLGRQYSSLSEPGQSELRDLHDRLDDCVHRAYGFSSEEESLAELLALNHSVSLEETEGLARPKGPGTWRQSDEPATTLV